MIHRPEANICIFSVSVPLIKLCQFVVSIPSNQILTRPTRIGMDPPQRVSFVVEFAYGDYRYTNTHSPRRRAHTPLFAIIIEVTRHHLDTAKHGSAARMDVELSRAAPNDCRFLPHKQSPPPAMISSRALFAR